MKRGFFCVTVLLVSLLASSCNWIEGMLGKKQEDIYATLTIKYLREIDGADGPDYVVDSINLPMLKGTVLTKDDYAAMLSSRIGILQATSASDTPKFTVSKFFDGVASEDNAFLERSDYADPSLMPLESKLGMQVEDLTLYPVSKDMTLYAYYERAAEKEYSFRIHCLNFDGKTYGEQPTYDNEVEIRFAVDERLTINDLMRKLGEVSTIEKDGAEIGFNTAKGINGLSHYVIDSVYQLQDYEVEDYNQETATSSESLSRWKKMTVPTFDSEQEYYVGYSLDKSYRRFRITFHHLKYTEGFSDKVGFLEETTYPIDVEYDNMKDESTLEKVVEYMDMRAKPLNDITLNGYTSTINGEKLLDWYKSGDNPFNFLEAKMSMVGVKVKADFDYTVPRLREADTSIGGDGAVTTSGTLTGYQKLKPITVKRAGTDELILDTSVFETARGSGAYKATDVYVISKADNLSE